MTITYLQLTAIHKETVEAKNGLMTDQVFRNHRSTLKAYLTFCNRDEDCMVGREFTVEFQKKIRLFGDHIALQNRKTAADKLSILRTWKRSVDQHLRGVSLKAMSGQSAFHKELRMCIASSGLTLREIADETNSDIRTITSWHDGVMPSGSGLPALRRLEKVLGVERGYLEGKLVLPRDDEKKKADRPSDQFSVRFRRSLADPYYLPASSLSPRLVEEWRDFLEFKTTTDPAPLKRGSKARWRELPIEKADAATRREPLVHTSPGIVVNSARATLQLLRSLLGFLIKGKNANKAVGGLGLDIGKLDSLAVFAIPEFVRAYFNFMKARSDGLVHNGHANNAGLIVGLCREVEGYLRQQPAQFAHKVQEFAQGRSWDQLCNETVETCLRWQSEGLGKKSRDPEKMIQPLLQTTDMLAPFKRAIQQLDLAAAAATTASIRQATYKRNALILALSLFNPLRQRTLTIIKYVKPGQAYESASNLYQKEDGQWWLRFERGDFKNDGSKPENYDAPIARALSLRIEEYLRVYRPILVRKNPDCTAFFVSKDGEKIGYIGTPISRLAKEYFPELVRLGPHLLRHIVATNFLRKNPGKYTLLSGLLHDTLATVLKTYAHGKTESSFLAHEDNMREFYEGI